MKRIAALYFLLLTFAIAPAQNPAKGMKALEDKNFSEAQKIFSDLLILDENDIAGNYGMSRVHSASASGVKDNEKSLEFLLKAEAAYKSADSKTLAKLEGAGITKVAMADQRSNLERAFLEDAKKAGTIEAYDAFLERFPSSGVAGAAENSRNSVAWMKAKALNTVDAYNDFIAKYPKAAEINEAKTIRNELATKQALATNTSAAYTDFLQKYHDAPQVPQIQQRLYAVAYEDCVKTNTQEAWEAYIRNYPDSIFLNKAKEALNYIKAGIQD